MDTSSGLELQVSPVVDDAELATLHSAAFGSCMSSHPWAARLQQHSLFWITARLDGPLVGFVNVIGDGGAHAVLLDTCVSPVHQGRRIGRHLVTAAADEARSRGCTWLHADYSPELVDFYERICGLRPSHAGLVRLA